VAGQNELRQSFPVDSHLVADETYRSRVTKRYFGTTVHVTRHCISQ